MSSKIYTLDLDTIEYPDSDGELMAENNEQLKWIILIKTELEAIFEERTDVAVEGDLLWYPVKGDNQDRRAPDAMVIIGRPKGYRGSYKQWEEDDIAPQVVFEILSPSNDNAEMLAKRLWYERYGVEEYYEYDPDYNQLRGWRNTGNGLQPIPFMQGWVSPRLGIRFEQDLTGELRLFRPDGQPFRTLTEVYNIAGQERQRAEQEHQRAEHERQRALAEHQRAEQERQRAEQEKREKEDLQKQLEQERQRIEQLMAQLETLKNKDLS
jgi:Uma2 family endonuclease